PWPIGEYLLKNALPLETAGAGGILPILVIWHDSRSEPLALLDTDAQESRCPYEIFPPGSKPTPSRSTNPAFAGRFLRFGKDRPSTAGRRERASGSEIAGSPSATPVGNSATWR